MEIRAQEIVQNQNARNICLTTMDFAGNSLKRECLKESEEKPMPYSPQLMHFQLTANKFILYRAKLSGVTGSEYGKCQFGLLTIQ